MAERVEKALNKLVEVAMHMGMTAMFENVMDSFAMAHPFLDVCLGWIELWRAVVSQPMIKIANKKEVAFYQGQVKTIDFYISWVLPAAFGKMKALQSNITAVMDMPDEAFAG